MDFYKILGIPRTADDEEIKKAYKKLALKWHPDKNENKADATNKFKEIGEAYSVLGDPEKRRRYDNGEQENVGGGMPDVFNIFNNFFNMGMNNFNIPFRNIRTEKKIPHDITLNELYNGCKIKKNIIRLSYCNECNGNGTKDKQEHKCSKCNGQGRIRITRQLGMMTIQQELSCDNCNGTLIDKNIEKCVKCQGKKKIEEEYEIEAKIDKGFGGNGIMIPNIGDIINGQQRENIILMLLEKEHPIFKREGEKKEDLIMRHKMKLADALLMRPFKFQHLDGIIKVITPEKIISPSMAMIIQNLGMPTLGGSGTLTIKFEIEFPKELSKEQRDILEKILL